MSKKFLLLLLLFCLLLCAYVAVVLASNTSLQSGDVKKLLTPTRPASVLYSLSLTSASQAVIPQQPNTIRVSLDEHGTTNSLKPHIIQLELSYNPLALLTVSMQPGDFFGNPAVLLNTIDLTTGRISYAIEISEDTDKTSGTVAIMTFTPNPAFTGKQTPIIFLPKTSIKGTDGSNLHIATYGTNVQFGELTGNTSR